MTNAGATLASRLARPSAYAFAAARGDALFDVASITCVGSSRRENSDAIYFDVAAGLFAIADGVGTLPGAGKVAELCLDYLGASALDDGSSTTRESALRERIVQVNGRLFAECWGARKRLLPGACTLTGVKFAEDRAELTVFHVGDSRLWLREDAGFVSVAEPQVVLRPSRRDPNKLTKRLASAIGIAPTVDPWLNTLPLRSNGALLLATDGFAEDEKLLRDEWLDGGSSNDEFAQRLEACVAAGFSDDASVVAVRWRPAG